MQIVIDKESLIALFTVAFYAICGGDYNDVKNTVIELLEKVSYTPLPKGHGYLVDYEELKNNAQEYGAYAETTLSHIKPKIIIEADTAESEDEV